MSWDMFVQDLPPNVRKSADIPKGFQPKPLGSRSDLIRRIREFEPRVDFSDPSWGSLTDPSGFIEFNTGDSEALHGFALHVHGGDSLAVFVNALLTHLCLRAVSMADDGPDILPSETAVDSVRAWRRYRDQVCGDNH